MRRDLVIVTAGRESTHRCFLEPDRNYDVMVIGYDEDGDYSNPVPDYLFVQAGFKFKLMYDVLLTRLHLIRDYDFIWQIDDDIVGTTAGANLFLELMRKYNLIVAQPSLTMDSTTSHRIIRNDPRCILRYVNSIDLMAPAWRRDFFYLIFNEFQYWYSTWGQDQYWAGLIQSLYPGEHKTAIIDEVQFQHTREVLTGRFYKELPADPWAEMAEMFKKYPLFPKKPIIEVLEKVPHAVSIGCINDGLS